ncbi:inositol monophosphatase family protein [Nesterenkonia flava]|uniref:Inositol-1-monophosphatase n=1 Tax=Nesterenkonia flava TaxID=469799 RepID=A0ABU1FRS9_9MICC|nr:inositol monophosphatase family protein [Nesterenkonia flava]MDR5710868.1 inositol monophosphatase family protein [Nesterenkonia flava]
MTEKTTSISVAELLEIAQEAAAAGAAVLAERETVAPAGTVLTQAESGVKTKSSESDLVTDFDRRAEEAVREVISRRRPHDSISGEEYGTTEVEDPSGYRWSIDPLDGTTNFVRGIAYYGTSVGVQGPDGDWLAGVVNAPALRRIWWGSRGQGSFTTRNGGEPVRLAGPTGDPHAGLLATGFGYDPDRRDEQTAAVAEMLRNFGNLRRLGAAALDICMVADGALDAYAEYGIWEHDWAAGALIAEEAGVPVRRPASPNSDEAPDWCVVGSLGIEHRQLQPTPTGL